MKNDTIESIADDVKRLPEFVHEKGNCKESIDLCLASRLSNATLKQLTLVIKTLAPEMKYRRDQPSAFLELDLADSIEDRGYVVLQAGNERIYVREYRERVERKILEIAENHPTIQAIRQGQELSDRQLIALERTLREELGGGDVELSKENIRKAYGFRVGSLLGFLRLLLKLDSLPDYEAVVKRRFEHYISGHQYNADQIRFLRAVQSVFLQKRTLQHADLYEGPLESFGVNAVDRLFTQQDVRELLALTDELAA